MKKKFLLFAFISIVFSIFMLILLILFDRKIGGNATNGSIENGKYFIVDESGAKNEVDSTKWILDYIVTIIFLVSLIVAVPSFFYIFIKYIAFPIWNGSLSKFN